MVKMVQMKCFFEYLISYTNDRGYNLNLSKTNIYPVNVLSDMQIF